MTFDWTPVREHVAEHGMRNSNTMAIAPTATISNISGCFPCIEPIYKNIYVKANISGRVHHRQPLPGGRTSRSSDSGNEEMLDKLKYYDGNLDQMIDEIPEHLRAKYKEAFEIDAGALSRA